MKGVRFNVMAVLGLWFHYDTIGTIIAVFFSQPDIFTGVLISP